MPGEVPLKQSREACWGARDAYWGCLDAAGVEEEEAKKNNCAALRRDFESACAGTWVRHFDRKRSYEQFKRQVTENERALNAAAVEKLPELRQPMGEGNPPKA